MRKQTFIACIPFAVMLILYMYRKYRKDFFKRIIPIVLSAVLLLFCWGIHEIAYRGNSEWKEFREYDAARIELLDYSLPEYDQNINFYSELGFSENDFAILKEWKNGDKDYFNVETLGKIVELSHELKKTPLIQSVLMQSIFVWYCFQRSIWSFCYCWFLRLLSYMPVRIIFIIYFPSCFCVMESFGHSS